MTTLNMLPAYAVAVDRREPDRRQVTCKARIADLQQGQIRARRVLRSESPDMIEQEIWGYLLTHYAISALICTAATSAGIDPDRVKFKRTIRAVRRRVADPAFPPDQQQHVLDQVKADITGRHNLNQRRERTYPRVVKRPRHNSYHVKKPGDRGQRHSAPPTISLVNLPKPQAAA